MKTRRQKTGKARKAPTAARNRGSSSADLQKQLEQRTCELAEAQKHLAEARDEQTATSEVLRIIRPASCNPCSRPSWRTRRAFAAPSLECCSGMKTVFFIS